MGWGGGYVARGYRVSDMLSWSRETRPVGGCVGNVCCVVLGVCVGCVLGCVLGVCVCVWVECAGGGNTEV